MKNFISLLLFLFATTTNAAAVKSLQADQWLSADLTKTWTPPSVSTQLDGITNTATLTNKTLTSPAINSATISGTTVAGGAWTMTNGVFTGGNYTSPTVSGSPIFSGAITNSGVINGGIVSNTQMIGVTITSGTATLTNGTYTNPTISGGAASNSFICNGCVLRDGTVSQTDGLFTLVNSVTPSKKFQFDLSSIAANTTRSWIVPDFSGTFVGIATSQTILNKTLDSVVVSGTGGSVFGGAVNALGAVFTNITVSGASQRLGGAITSTGVILGGATSGTTDYNPTVSGSVIVVSGTGFIGGSFTNAGTITGGVFSAITLAGANILTGTVSGGTLYNPTVSGSVIVVSGTGFIGGAFTNSGVITGGTFSAVTVSGASTIGGAVTATGAVFTNITVSGASQRIGGTIVNSGTISGGAISAATFTGAGILTGTVSGGTLYNPTVSGSVIVVSGTGFIGGLFTNAGTVSGGQMTGITVSGTQTNNFGSINNFKSNLIMSLGNGLDFSATANSSGTTVTETLTDAENGTCTPTFTYTTTNPTGATYTNQSCEYQKINKHVIVWGRVTYSSKGAGGVGNAQISGLPFGTTTTVGTGVFSLVQGFTVLFPNVCYINLGVCRLVVQSSAAAGNDTIDFTANMTNTSDIIFKLDYPTSP